MKPSFLSGIQPTASIPHLGNYLGALKQWVSLQNEFHPYYCIVDLHALTVPQNPEVLKAATYATYAIALAVGVDPKLSTLFVQSQNPFHSELGWILNCFTSMGELNRMTQFKEKSAKQSEIISAGLFDYPVLMAADILLYDSVLVPVGEDQIQHVEITRDIANRFNNKYGETFVLPQVRIVKEGARVMSLVDPTKKMSKSDENQNACLFLLDEPEVIRKKIKSAVTDSESSIIADPKRPGLYNLMAIYKALSGEEFEAIEERYKGRGYREFKEDLAEIVVKYLAPIQAKYHTFVEDKGELERLMKAGAEQACEVAAKKVQSVKAKLGLVL
jgi:tryptophanyl-tRNA synthetase